MTKQQTIQHIAKTILKLETTDTRNSDDLDFSQQAVWTLQRAIEAAYEAGRASKSLPSKRALQHA